MSVTASVLRAGTNSYLTPASDVFPNIQEIMHAGVLTGLRAVAQASPNMTVKIKSGNGLISATPSSESARLIRGMLSADTSVIIAANSSGSTKYDLVYFTLPAAALHDPALSGDFTEALTFGTERHTNAGESLTQANAILLAEVTVANGASSISQSNISDRRDHIADGWVPFGITLTYSTAVTTPTKYEEFLADGDCTRLLGKGDKIKLDQTTTKYFSIILATYAAGSDKTTFRVTAGSSYTLANAAITNPYFSKKSTPNGFPSFFVYTSTKATGSGTWGTFTDDLTRFTIDGSNCRLDGVVAGTQATSATAFVSVTIPVTESTTINNTVGFGCRINTATATVAGHSYVETTNNRCVFSIYDSSNMPTGALTVRFSVNYRI